MKVLGINGSHRAGKGTAALLQAGLDEAGRPQWRPVKADEIGFLLARQLGREAVSLAVRLG